jgi:hypothetical protein
VTAVPRKDVTPPPERPPAPHRIDPHAVYDLLQARIALRVAKGTLPREMKLGRLRYSKRAGKVLLLGAWLLQWVEDGEVRRPQLAADKRDAAPPAA